MAGLQLGSRETHVAARRTEIKPHRVRIGVLSLLSLLIMISLAVLAVLTFTTANATLVMSQRQANAETQRYLDEVAAQEFVAQLDGVLATVRQGGGKADGEASGQSGAARNGAVRADDSPSKGNLQKVALQAVEGALGELCSQARDAADESMQVYANVEKSQVNAQFDCGNGRVLSIALSIQPDATYRIDRWSMSAVQNQEQPEGQLLIVD